MTCRKQIKKREVGQGETASAWGDQDAGSKSQSEGNLGNGGKGESSFIDLWLVDKNKGDNYVVISIWLVTFLVVPYVKAPTNLAFNKLLKMTEPVR